MNLTDLHNFHKFPQFSRKSGIEKIIELNLSDQEYDNLFRELQALEKGYPEFIDSQSPTQRVGHPVESGVESFNHRTPMLSLLNAITNEEIFDFNKRINKWLKIQFNFLLLHVCPY